MTSTPTLRLRLQKQATGDNPDAWGEVLNAALDLVDEAVGGFAQIAVSGTVTLAAANFTSDQARRGVLRFTGTGGNIVIPAVEKLYLIDNRCTGDVVVKTASTPGATLPSGSFRFLYCDGATVNAPSPTGTTALGTPFTPAGTIAATNVQDAIFEVAAERVQMGTGIGQQPSNVVKIGWNGAGRLKATVDNTDLGVLWAESYAAAQLFAAGYQRLPSGLILQWGNPTNPATDYSQPFPITFPTTAVSVVASVNFFSGSTSTGYLVSTDTLSASSFNVRTRVLSGGSLSAAGNLPICWMAVGY